MQKRPYRRRNYFIKKNFQSRFIVRFLIISLIGSVAAVALFNFLAFRRIDDILFSMTIPFVNTGRVLLREAVIAGGVVLAAVVIVLILTARGVHVRIVRSLDRIRADISRLIRGDLGTRIMLSSDDEFRDFADEVNVMVGDLNRRMADLKGRFVEIGESVRKLQAASEGESKILVGKILSQIDAAEKSIEAIKR